MIERSPAAGEVRFGDDFELDFRTYELRRAGRVLKLERIPKEILLLLVSRQGEITTRDQIVEKIWGKDVFLDTDNSINGAIRKIRTVLRDDPEQPRFIQTVSGTGYRFVAAVETVCPATPIPPVRPPDVFETKGLRSELAKLASSQPLIVLKQRRIGPWFIGGAAILLVALGALTLTSIRERLFPTPISALALKTRRSVAVLGFKNLSGREEEAWISAALSEMLGAELAAGQELRMVSSEDVARMKLDLSLPAADTYSRDTLSKVRNHLSTDMVVLGSYLALGKDSGGKIRIDLQLQDTRQGETVIVISREGAESDLASLVSQTGANLRQKLNIGDVTARDAPEIRAALPENSEAARLYAEGLVSLENFDALAARITLEKAIAADPTHALSHSLLADAWFRLGYDAKAKDEAKKALDLSSTLPREQRLLVEGRYHEFANDLPAAVEVYKTLRNYFPDNLTYGLRLASAQTKSGAGKEALQTIERIRRLSKPASEDPRIGVEEATAAESLGDFRRAQQAAATAASTAQMRGARLTLAEARFREAWAWDRLGDLDRASREMYEARALAANAGNPQLTLRTLRGIGLVFYDRGDFTQALKFYEQALDISRKTGALRQVSVNLTDVGNVLYEQGKTEEAKQYYEEGLKVDRETAYAKGIASNQGSIANTLDGLGDLVGATQMQEQSLEGFRAIGDKRGEASTLNNLGSVLLERGELASAKKNFDQAIVLQQQIGYQRGRGFSLTLLADVLLQQNQIEQAKKTIEQAIALRTEMKDESNVARNQVGLAQILLELQRPAEAESLARAASVVFENQKEDGSGSLAQTILSRALLAQGKGKEAKVAADRAISLSQNTTDRPSRFEAVLAAAEVNAKSGQTAEAIKALESTGSEARLHGYSEYELETQLDLDRIELHSGRAAAGKAHLRQLQAEAQAKGFLLLAHKAAAAMI